MLGRPQNPPKMPKNRHFWEFPGRQKWPKMTILLKRPIVRSSRMAKNAERSTKKRPIQKWSPKVPIFRPNNRAPASWPQTWDLQTCVSFSPKTYKNKNAFTKARPLSAPKQRTSPAPVKSASTTLPLINFRSSKALFVCVPWILKIQFPEKLRKNIKSALLW